MADETSFANLWSQPISPGFWPRRTPGGLRSVHLTSGQGSAFPLGLAIGKQQVWYEYLSQPIPAGAEPWGKPTPHFRLLRKKLVLGG